MLRDLLQNASPLTIPTQSRSVYELIAFIKKHFYFDQRVACKVIDNLHLFNDNAQAAACEISKLDTLVFDNDLVSPDNKEQLTFGVLSILIQLQQSKCKTPMVQLFEKIDVNKTGLISKSQLKHLFRSEEGEELFVLSQD
jgi:hypothetical protein